ncbi:HAUS augmin-like complex subunit 5 isoform X2 [Apodemus sylvaticus]|uniref:HAUS augmin-like complex subunit 5 isoform X2 n=1 Tax=Apodemus sylvaticus TaxID=10129 RepID=UPI0022427DE2|nr:HAUS augmin-like complex subunit 5 isoform X2 [Apodemus sylvaticus]
MGARLKECGKPRLQLSSVTAMELTQEERELSRWAAEEMAVSPAARPRESTLRRLCLGQGADIWAYVVQHVHSQRNIKTIQGNLLWYGHQDNPKIRQELDATVTRHRAENQEIDQSLELMDQKTEAQDVAMTQTLQSLKNTQLRALLLQAQAGAVQRQKRGLQDPKQRLQNQLKRLQDMQRKAKVDVTFRPVVSAAPALEPQADVRAACSLRTQFLQNLLTSQAKGGSILSPCDDHVGTSYQQWLTSVETLLTNHPAGHILAALEYLAAERESEIRSLCSGDGLKEEELSRPQAPDSSNPSQVLPSTAHLIQEDWQAVGALVAQRSALLSERQVLTSRLQGLVEEVERLSLGSSKRKVLLLGLRHSGLWAEREALRAQSQELESAVERRQLLLRELQAKRQQILQWRQLVEERQEQIRLLIKGNSASKTRLSRGPEEVLALIQQKLVPTSEAVAPQSQELLRCLKEEAKQLPHALLDPLLLYHAHGLKTLSRVLPSIHQLHPTTPRGSRLISLSHTLGLPVGKASELLLPKAASLRQDLLFLQDQWGLRGGNLCVKTSVPPGPSTQELLQIQVSQEKEQNESMGQTLKKLSNLLKQALEQIPELQGVIEDWWEQPGQAALSEELHQGLSLPQWQLRWLQAQVALQQRCK